MRTSLFSLNLLLVIITVLALEDGNARVHVSGLDESKLNDPLKGRILIEEMNCVSCHKEPVIAESSKKSPRLSAVGNRLNPDHIRDFLLSPQKVKPGKQRRRR